MTPVILKSIAIVAVIAFALSCVPVAAQANILDSLGLSTAPSNLDVPDGDLPTVIKIVINALLSIVGIIAVAVIVYGGFLYITSLGTDDRINKAKRTILYGIIGLLVVAIAGSVVIFIFRAIL